ncbi:MAG TPA: hypothetical protein PKI05_07430, partial [Thermogutta sp.]|nr:hypothetical protein [Thermogutta sp.]
MDRDLLRRGKSLSRQRHAGRMFVATLSLAVFFTIVSSQVALSNSADVLRFDLPELPSPEIASIANRVYLVLEKQAHFLLDQLKPW